jgi:hypothetical protein
MKESIGRVADDLGVSKREVYLESIKLRKNEKGEKEDPAPRKG